MSNTKLQLIKTKYTFPTREKILERIERAKPIILTYSMSLFTFNSFITLVGYVLALV